MQKIGKLVKYENRFQKIHCAKLSYYGKNGCKSNLMFFFCEISGHWSICDKCVKGGHLLSKLQTALIFGEFSDIPYNYVI